MYFYRVFKPATIFCAVLLAYPLRGEAGPREDAARDAQAASQRAADNLRNQQAAQQRAA